MWLTTLMLFCYASQTEADTNQLRRTLLPAPPIYSGDNAVVVYSSQQRAAYRGAVLVFVNRSREMFQYGLNMKLGSQNHPVEIRIGDKSDGDTSVLTARLRDAKGNVRERIELPDPEGADLERFQRALAVAFLRIWMVEAGGTEATMRNLPNWLINGMMRYMQGTNRQLDFDRTYLIWSHGCLPTAEELFAFESFAADQEPAVAAVLAGWFLEKRAHAFKALLKETATGRKWSVSSVAELLTGNQFNDFDRTFDLRMLELGRRVIQPGITTAGIVSRFRSELLLFPTDYGMMFNSTNAYLDFAHAITLLDNSAVLQAARYKILQLRAAAAGRDGTLLALSERYELFLRSLATAKEPEVLETLLREADEARREIEQRVAKGVVLGAEQLE